MAGEQEELTTPGVEEQQGQQPTEGQEQQGAEPEDSGPGPYDELAQRMGWVPRDQFNGPEEQWKPAEQFILDGRDIQRGLATEVKGLKSQMDLIARTTGQMVEQTVSERVNAKVAEYNRLVDEGDAQGAFRVSQEIQSLRSTVPANQMPGAPPPEAQEFAQRNAAWFNDSNPLAKGLAIDVSNRLAAQGYDTATQLREAEKEVRRQYPQLFAGQQNGQKPPPGVHGGGQRAPSSKANSEKGFADMPEAARKVATDMAERGVIPSKEAYATNYWKNAGGNA